MDLKFVSPDMPSDLCCIKCNKGKMAKDREKAQARLLYVQLGKSQKEISDIVDISEKQIGVWAKDGNWKAARTAFLTTNENMLENGKQAVSNLSDILLDLQKERAKAVAQKDKLGVALLDKSILSMSDAIAKTNAAIMKFEKQNALTLVTYLNVMGSIFQALRNEDPALYDQTLDFQERHVNEMAKKIG